MSVKIHEAGLLAIAPSAASWIIAGILHNQHLLAKYGIDTETRVDHFLAQCAKETKGFTRLEENLYYTTAKRLMQVWPSRFKSVSAANPYLRNPKKLANKVYGGRLGNILPGEGWLYRGSGCKNTTGKNNFKAVQKVTGLPVVDNPEMLRRFPEALESACIYWQQNNLNRFADAGDVKRLTRAIQGGNGGLADRRVYTERAKRVNWHTGQAHVGKHTAEIGAIILRQGNRGKMVESAQQMLLDHGYDIAVDGLFGGGTYNTVVEFQEAAGLMADGVIGPETWKALKVEPENDHAPIAVKPIPEANILISLFIRILKGIFNAKTKV